MLQRRAKQWGITTYGSISDAELDEVVAYVLSRFPQSGEVMVRGHLQAHKASNGGEVKH